MTAATWTGQPQFGSYAWALLGPDIYAADFVRAEVTENPDGTADYENRRYATVAAAKAAAEKGTS
jgi:hypothetical protein